MFDYEISNGYFINYLLGKENTNHTYLGCWIWKIKKTLHIDNGTVNNCYNIEWRMRKKDALLFNLGQ